MNMALAQVVARMQLGKRYALAANRAALPAIRERALDEASKASRHNAPRLFYSPLGVFSHQMH
jgi:hypothetical protein